MLKLCAVVLCAREPGRSTWSARVSRGLITAVCLLAVAVTSGLALMYVVGGHGSRPSAIGRPNTDAPAACADAPTPDVAAPDDARTTVTAPDDATTTVAAPDDPQPSVPERVLYVGDSIAWQTSETLQELLPDTEVDTLVYGGTAPCDWVTAVTNFPHDVDVVLFSFIGNNLSEATGHATGEALLTQYRDDLKEMCAELAPARCVAVGQPVLGPDVESTFGVDGEPTAMFRHEAQVGSWEFVDAGAAVETPDGSFDPSVRQPDGVHLDAIGVERFAIAIANYLLDK